MKATTLLKISNLKKNYGKTTALVNFNLDGKAGSVHTIFGENGSGKSTAVKVLSGVVSPNQGTIAIQGRTISKFEPQKLLQIGIATVFQEVLVAPNCSVLENIFLGYDGLFKYNIPHNKKIILAEEVLSRLTKSKIPLKEEAQKLPLAQKQIIVIARALVRNPQVLILDESTASLDIGDQTCLFNLIRQMIKEGKLVIFISHRIDEVIELSDDLTLLHHGSSVSHLSKKEITTKKILELLAEARFDEKQDAFK